MHKKGNISIVVTFILALVSLLALLSASHVRSIIQSSGNLFAYYKAYYLAKGGIELSLLHTQEHDIGFEATMSGDAIDGLFACNERDCTTVSRIQSRTHYHESMDRFITKTDDESQCTEENAISLAPGETRTTPLFYDGSGLTGEVQLMSLLSQDLDIELINIGDNEEYSVGLSLGSGAHNDLDRHQLIINGNINDIDLHDFFHKLNITYTNTGENPSETQLIYYLGNQPVAILPISQTFNEYHNYLLIKNTSSSGSGSTNNGQPAQFCIKVNNEHSELPRGNIIITSQGVYNNQHVSLQASQSTQLPDFLFSTFITR